MNRLIQKFILSTLLLASALRAEITIPLPDFAVSNMSSMTSIAIWSSTSVSEAAGNTIAITFPAGMVVPPTNISNCTCVFVKYTDLLTNAFSPKEVTVTAGSVSGQRIQLTLPQALGVGLFYVRFDEISGIRTPALAGIATLVMADPSGNTIESRGFTIRDPNSNDGESAKLTGTVLDTALKPVPGAMVLVTTAAAPGSIMDVEIGPRAETPTAKSTDVERIVASTLANGSFSIKVPFKAGGQTYNVYTTYSRLNAGVLETYKTASVSVTVNSSGTTSVTIPTPSKVCDPNTCPG